MKKQTGNMYPNVTTWNPLGGECPHKCSYCSTNALKKRYEAVKNKYSGPLHLYFNYPPESDKIIFVCAQNDLFAELVPTAWILNVLQRCRAKENTYLFQTKNPARIIPFLLDLPNNSILCTTIESNRYYNQMGLAPSPMQRAEAMYKIYYKKYVTIEPIMDFDIDEMVELIKLCRPTKVNIGADSKGNHLPEPSKEKLLALIDELQKFTTIDRKTNLSRLLK